MAKALNTVINQEFISEHDDEEEVKTTWILRSLTGLEFLECCSAGFVDHEKIINYGLVGWKDFMGADGNPIEFHRADIQRIPATYLQDISFKIQTISTVSEEETKNSSSQSK